MNLIFILIFIVTRSSEFPEISFIKLSEFPITVISLPDTRVANLTQNRSIGKWRYNGSDFPKSTFEIKVKNSEYICLVTFLDDGSSSTEKLTKTGTQRYIVNRSRTSEYYKINSRNGQLEMWDQDGLFIIASKIQ